MTYQQKSYNESPIKRKFLDFRFQFIKEYYDIINKLTNHPYQKYNELFYSFFFYYFLLLRKKIEGRCPDQKNLFRTTF